MCACVVVCGWMCLWMLMYVSECTRECTYLHARVCLCALRVRALRVRALRVRACAPVRARPCVRMYVCMYMYLAKEHVGKKFYREYDYTCKYFSVAILGICYKYYSMYFRRRRRCSCLTLKKLSNGYIKCSYQNYTHANIHIHEHPTSYTHTPTYKHIRAHMHMHMYMPMDMHA